MFLLIILYSWLVKYMHTISYTWYYSCLFLVFNWYPVTDDIQYMLCLLDKLYHALLVALFWFILFIFLSHFIILLLSTHHDQYYILFIISWVYYLPVSYLFIFPDSNLLDTCYTLGFDFQCTLIRSLAITSCLSLMSS